MSSTDADKTEERQQRRQEKKDHKRQGERQNTEGRSRGGGGGGARGVGSAKLRGLPKDAHESEGLAMRPDGYVRVDELLARPKLRELDFATLQEIVKNDAKSRYSLVLEADANSSEEAWWIRANQGHSMKTVVLDLEPIKSHADIPSGIAVHGTTKRAWESIKEQGLSKMSRNHIHFAQGVAGSGVISGMRSSSQILIFIDVQKAIDAGIKFHLSANGVILTEGDENGFLHPEFFSRVQTADGKLLTGWDGPEGVPAGSTQTTHKDTKAARASDTKLMEELEKKVEATTV